MPYFTYILASKTGTLYIGVTNDLERRVAEHKAGTGSVFKSKYAVDRLVYYCESDNAVDAIALEKRLKGWSRARKLELILSSNPYMRDLTEDW
jgi:putative endonuclease